MARLALILLALTSCGGVPASSPPQPPVDGGGTVDPTPPPPPPGSPRIVQRVWSGSDGSKVVMGDYIDTLLGVRCTPTDAEPGIVRCLPYTGYTSYRDASCTQPLAYTAKGCRPEKYAITRPATSVCASPAAPTVYTVGYAVTPTTLYVIGDAGCIDVSGALPNILADYALYDTTGQVPLSAFMAGRYGY